MRLAFSKFMLLKFSIAETQFASLMMLKRFKLVKNVIEVKVISHN